MWNGTVYPSFFCSSRILKIYRCCVCNAYTWWLSSWYTNEINKHTHKHTYEKKAKNNTKKWTKSKKNIQNTLRQDGLIYFPCVFVCNACIFNQVTINYIIPRQTHAHASIADIQLRKQRMPEKLNCIQGFLFGYTILSLTIRHFAATFILFVVNFRVNWAFSLHTHSFFPVSLYSIPSYMLLFCQFFSFKLFNVNACLRALKELKYYALM